MSIRRFGILVAVLVAAAAAPSAWADDQTVKREIQEVCDRYVAAWMSRDLPAILREMAPDFVYQDLTKKTSNRTQSEVQLKKELAAPQSMIQALRVDRVVAKGDLADTWQTWTLTDFLTDPHGKKHEANGRDTYRVQYRKTGHGWQIVRVEMLATEFVIEGKKVDPKNPFGALKQRRQRKSR